MDGAWIQDGATLSVTADASIYYSRSNGYSPGSIQIFAGGSLIGEGRVWGGIVTDGGTISALEVFSNQFDVAPGGIAVATQAGFKAIAWAESGGTTSALQLSSGAQEYVNGTASGTVVSGGGREYIRAAGSSISAQVSAGGALVVSSGGTASSTTVFGGAETVLASGSASGTTISSGYQYVYGTASGTTILSGGHEVVASGGDATNATVSLGGGLTVDATGEITGGLTIDGGAVSISGSAGAGQTVSFGANVWAVLGLDNLAGFQAAISGMSGPGQEVDLGGLAFSNAETATWSQTGNSGTLTVSDGGQTAKLTLIGTYSSTDFHLATDGKGGTYVDDPRPAAGFAQAMAGFSGRTQAFAAIHAGGTALMSASPLVPAGSSGR
jgi:fibronectin-binding autotransporter adhesin